MASDRRKIVAAFAAPRAAPRRVGRRSRTGLYLVSGLSLAARRLLQSHTVTCLCNTAWDFQTVFKIRPRHGARSGPDLLVAVALDSDGR